MLYFLNPERMEKTGGCLWQQCKLAQVWDAVIDDLQDSLTLVDWGGYSMLCEVEKRISLR